jgi:hypothetical protein
MVTETRRSTQSWSNFTLVFSSRDAPLHQQLKIEKSIRTVQTRQRMLREQEDQI